MPRLKFTTAVLVVLFAATLETAAATTQEAPIYQYNKTYIRDDSFSRISVGFQASKGDFPTIVNLASHNAKFATMCGGVLIAPRAVLTAAHCTVIYTKEEMIAGTVAYIGLVSLNDRDVCNKVTCQTRRIVAVYRHPLYNKTTYDNDLSILILDAPTTITPSPRATSDPAPGSQQRVAGWGLDARTLSLSTNLQFVDLTMGGDSDCPESYYDGATSICALSTGSTNQYTLSACQGDSGGPLFKRGTTELLGTVSYGIKKEGETCGGYTQTVFMSMAYFQPWIDSILAIPAPPGPPSPPPKPPKASPPPPSPPPPSPPPSPPPKPPKMRPPPPSPSPPPPKPPKMRPPPPKLTKPPPPLKKRPPPPKRKRPPPPAKNRPPPPKATTTARSGEWLPHLNVLNN